MDTNNNLHAASTLSSGSEDREFWSVQYSSHGSTSRMQLDFQKSWKLEEQQAPE